MNRMRNVALASLVVGLCGCKDLKIQTENDQDSFHWGEPVDVWVTYKGDPVPGTASVAWSSDRSSGSLGSGARITLTNLAPGEHEVRARTTIDGKDAKADRDIRIINDEPTPRILEPRSGSEVAVGTAVTFAGTVVDTEDGSVPVDRYRWRSSIDGDLGRGSSVETRDLSPGRHRITLSATDDAGTEGTGSIELEVTNQAPVATIAFPSDGYEVSVGNPVTLRGSARDLDPLRGPAVIPSSSLEWYSDEDGLLGAGAEVTVASLSGGRHRIELRAKDEFGTVGKARVRVDVVNAEPEVQITSPGDQTFHAVNSEVRFEATARDPDGYPIDSDAIVWRSSRDGRFGRGLSVTTSNLSPGEHRIRVRVTDEHGGETVESVEIEIKNDAPIARILSPADGASFDFGEAFVVRGRARDSEDGVVAASRMNWTVRKEDGDRDRLGRGERVTVRDLPIGTHRISLVAEDSSGTESNRASITVTIRNRAPEASILNPVAGATVAEGSPLLLIGQGRDPDRDQALTGNLMRWTARSGNITRDLGTGSRLEVTTLPAGSHTITLTAVDPDDASLVTRARVNVEVTPAGSGATASAANGGANGGAASGDDAAGNGIVADGLADAMASND